MSAKPCIFSPIIVTFGMLIILNGCATIPKLTSNEIMRDISKGKMIYVNDLGNIVLYGHNWRLTDVIVNHIIAKQYIAPDGDKNDELVTKVFDLPTGIISFDLKDTWGGEAKLFDIIDFSRHYYDSLWWLSNTYQSYEDFRDHQLEKYKYSADYEIFTDKYLIFYSYTLPEKRFIYEVNTKNGIKKVTIHLFKVENTEYSNVMSDDPWQCGAIIAEDEN